MHSLMNTAYAAAGNIDDLIVSIDKYIINPFIGLLFVLATVLFLVGLARYFLAGSAEIAQ